MLSLLISENFEFLIQIFRELILFLLYVKPALFHSPKCADIYILNCMITYIYIYIIHIKYITQNHETVAMTSMAESKRVFKSQTTPK